MISGAAQQEGFVSPGALPVTFSVRCEGWQADAVTGVCEMKDPRATSNACATAYDFRLLNAPEKQLLMQRCGCAVYGLRMRGNSKSYSRFCEAILAVRADGVQR